MGRAPDLPGARNGCWTGAKAAPIRRRLSHAVASRPGEIAQVAQLVEHATENRSVAGSIPALGTIPSFAAAPSAPGGRHGCNTPPIS